MTKADDVTYECPECGFTNHWTRDEVLRFGKRDIYRAAEKVKEDYYSLPCRNCAFKCPERYVVAIEREE